MPIRKRASRPRRKVNNRKSRVPRAMGRSAGPSIAGSDRSQYASIIETIDPSGLGIAITPNVLVNNAFSLSQFNRAKSLACQFQYYRAKRVTYVYTPLFNTYQEGVSGFSKPYMYTLMNRTQQFMLGGLLQLQHSGARPKPFTSVTKVTYVPNWCSPGLVARGPEEAPVINTGNQAQYAWLTTPFSDTGADDSAPQIEGALSTSLPTIDIPAITPNCVVYNGHTTYVDQPGSDAPVYNLLIQVHWEFKGAHYSAQKGSL